MDALGFEAALLLGGVGMGYVRGVHGERAGEYHS